MNWLLLIVGAFMLGLGIWAARNVKALVPPRMSRSGREQQEAVLVRGAAILTLTGAVFCGFGAYLLLVS